MRSPFRILGQSVHSALSKTSGFIAEAGFTHSLTPARNCTFGCTYCYVPTLGIYGGLKPEDWRRWGQFTTFKTNAPELLSRSLRPSMVIYCSPLVDPYQPAEAERRMLPAILAEVIRHPPKVFVIQTRGPMILRDLDLLMQLAGRTSLRISFSLTTDREDIRRLYEPHCAPIAERVHAIRELRRAGIVVHATLAPLLPSDYRQLLDLAIGATDRDVIGDPLHVRAAKRHGATTRDAARRIAAFRGHLDWFDAAGQASLVEKMKDYAAAAGRRFAVGPEGFSCLAQPLQAQHDPTPSRS